MAGRGAPAPLPPLPTGALEVVDLSQPYSDSMAGWRSTEKVDIEIQEVPIAHSVPQARISATYLSLVAHAGTHVDAARHFFPGGPAIDEYPIERFVCRGVAIDVRREGPHELTVEELEAADPGIRAGDAVLLSFGYAERYESPEYYDHPYLSGRAAEYLVEREVGLFGADVITPDQPAHRRASPFEYPVHGTLLGAGVPIVENLGPGVAEVAGREFLFVMAPFRIPGGDASPVVPLALLQSPS